MSASNDMDTIFSERLMMYDQVASLKSRKRPFNTTYVSFMSLHRKKSGYTFQQQISTFPTLSKDTSMTGQK